MERCDENAKKEINVVISKLITSLQKLKRDQVPCMIEEGLFLGSLGSAAAILITNKSNISHILTVGSIPPPSNPGHFTRKRIQVDDKIDANISQYFDECFEFIDEAKCQGGVLIHCFAGISRSVTVVVAYLMKKKGMPMQEALLMVRSLWARASPNAGFLLQLINFQSSLKSSLVPNEVGIHNG